MTALPHYIDSRENQIIFTTRNEAPYVTDELRKKIFTRGYSTKAGIGGNKNHGYGLNNLLEIIKPYQGRLYLENLEYGEKNYVQFQVVI